MILPKNPEDNAKKYLQLTLQFKAKLTSSVSRYPYRRCRPCPPQAARVTKLRSSGV